MSLIRLVGTFAATPWALERRRLEALADILLDVREASEVRASFFARGEPTAPRRAATSSQSVAVIPVQGVIAHRANMVQDICGPGGTSTEVIDAAIRAAAADPSVRSIVLDVDSPGGSVFGVQELAATIMQVRAQKPIAAVANSTASSAAYWIATAAHEFFVTPSGEVGSIGVYGAHVDTTRADALAGKKTTLISAGKYKAEGFGPLTNEAKAHMQDRIDAYYSRFVNDVARQRRVSVDAVRNGYGQGRALGASAALAAGMVDGVATLSEVISKYARRTTETANRSLALAGAQAAIAAAESSSSSRTLPTALALARLAIAKASLNYR